VTDDIVARLRDLAAEFPSLNGIMDSEWTNAADEIERLRQENRQLRDFQVEACGWGLGLIEPIPWNSNAKHQRKEDRTNGNH